VISYFHSRCCTCEMSPISHFVHRDVQVMRRWIFTQLTTRRRQSWLPILWQTWTLTMEHLSKPRWQTQHLVRIGEPNSLFFQPLPTPCAALLLVNSGHQRGVGLPARCSRACGQFLGSSAVPARAVGCEGDGSPTESRSRRGGTAPTPPRLVGRCACHAGCCGAGTPLKDEPGSLANSSLDFHLI